MKQLIFLLIAAVVGGVGGYLLTIGRDESSAHTEAGEDKPLYWVAPMDPNYRRDAPGKSPMGMDLVPVYKDDQAGKGVVRISPGVEHNIGVKTGKVVRGVLKQRLSTVARVKYDENQLAAVYPRVDGWLEKLHVKAVGDNVEVGDPLYDIYSPTLVNAQEEYLAGVRNRNEQLVKSSRERLKSLGVSERRIDELARSREVAQTVTISSRHKGVVRSLDVKEGGHVSANTRIMEIAGLDPVWVTAELFESDAASVAIGDEVELRFGFQPGDIKRASIDFIYPTIESLTRTLEVRSTLPNSDGLLRPSMFASADIVLEHAPSLLVPVSAVIRTGLHDRVVLTLGDGEFKSIAVKLGRFGDEFVEVESGLAEGDTVVTSAQFMIDSESASSSDFSRMQMAQVDHDRMNHDGMGSTQTEAEVVEPAAFVWAKGVIRSLDKDARTVSLTHEPVLEWGWPTMTMTMSVSDDTDISMLVQGSAYRFKLAAAPGSQTGYLVYDFKPGAEAHEHHG